VQGCLGGRSPTLRAALVAVLFALGAHAGAATALEKTPAEGAVSVRFEEGEARLVTDARARTRLGLVLAPLTASRRAASLECMAEVVDVTELLALRAELAGLTAERVALGTLAASHRAQVERLAAARAAGAAVDASAIHAAEVSAAERAAEAAALDVRAEGLRIRLAHTWGQPVLDAFSHSEQGKALSSGRMALLRISLPADADLRPMPTRITLTRAGEAMPARRARVLGRAPQTQGWQGTSLWAVVRDAQFLPGMRPAAWLPQGKARRGYALPASALVWAQGRRWIFVGTPAAASSAQEFFRLAVDGEALPDGGLFTPQKLPADAVLVTTGAHALLAEELRGTIPEEDDD
jgi:hypothetical protein